MTNEVYRTIKRNYDIKRQLKIDEANKIKAKIFQQNPSLQKIEDDINSIAIKSTKKILKSTDITRQIEQENMTLELEALSKKYELELNKIGYTRNDLEPKYDCIKCKDTGILEKSGAKFCTCFNQEVINLTYKQSNLRKLEEENFETFDIGYYSKNIDKEKYGINKSPLDNILSIKTIAEKFCENIKDINEKNLLFVGNTGLGKTFLANAIAKEVIKSGNSVIYQTAPILMDQIIDYKFSYDKTAEKKDQYLKTFEVDLIIIDDLGTEAMNNNKFTELFNIINTRLLENKKILISTNLSLNELYKMYDERVMSRLIGNFTICKFVGEDIRLKKKRIN